jgi:L-threonylcarbamoyladenylate synthase
MRSKEADVINIDRNFKNAIDAAKDNYLKGNVFIYPTDTLYGLGSNPFNGEAVDRINKLKGRESMRLYILLVGNIKNLLEYVEIKSENYLDFLLSVWPNPVSAVFRLNKKASSMMGIEKAAFRMPNHRFCLKLLEELKMPLICTTVSKEFQVPLIEPSIIKTEFVYDVDAIFYSNKKSYFDVSTLVDLTSSRPSLLRKGKLKLDKYFEKFNMAI